MPRVFCNSRMAFCFRAPPLCSRRDEKISNYVTIIILTLSMIGLRFALSNDKIRLSKLAEILIYSGCTLLISCICCRTFCLQPRQREVVRESYTMLLHRYHEAQDRYSEVVNRRREASQPSQSNRCSASYQGQKLHQHVHRLGNELDQLQSKVNQLQRDKQSKVSFVPGMKNLGQVKDYDILDYKNYFYIRTFNGIISVDKQFFPLNQTTFGKLKIALAKHVGCLPISISFTFGKKLQHDDTFLSSLNEISPLIRCKLSNPN